MLKSLLLLVFLGASLHAQVVTPAPRHVPLTVETYCQATVDRLRLTRSCWQLLKSGPSPEQMRMIWTKHRTTARDYLLFASRNRKEIEAYLKGEGRELKIQIDRLSADVKKAIEQLGDRK